EMSDEFVIRWEVDEISKLTNVYRYSPYEYHFGIPWRFEAGTETSKRTKHIKYFGIYLSCNEESECDLWRCERTATLTLIHWWNTDKNKIHEVFFGISFFIWVRGNSKLFRSENRIPKRIGFVKDDKIIVEARVKVKSVDFIRKRPTIDFSQDTADWDNIALKLEDGTVNVCRRFLMWHSPYFASILSPEQK
ncbi:hypothetical protein PENTCL1PPCAC_24793, partial [Pristionchus entomophagus]